MKEQNNIDEIFKEAFEQFEVDPGVEVWAKVQTGINAGTSTSSAVGAASASSSSWVATAIVGLALSAAAVGGYYFFNQKGEAKVEAAIEANKQTTKKNKPSNTQAPEQAVKDAEDISLDNVDSNISGDQIEASTQQPSSQQNTGQKLPKNQTDPVRQLSNGAKNNTNKNKIEDQKAEQSNPEISENTTVSTATETAETDNKNAPSADDSNAAVQSTIQSADSDANQEKSDNNTSKVTALSSKNSEEIIKIHIDFPNIITPNQDGTNDKFIITKDRSKGLDQVQEGSMQIRNNTGKIVAVWKGVNGSWDGTLPDGSNAPSGNYFFQFVYTADGEPQAPIKGIITLIK